MICPRTDRLTWNDHHMMLALVTAQRSPDPNTQVGSCIVDKRNRVIGLGYNGVARGISPMQIPWDRKAEDEFDTKYPYVVHAEANAILNTEASLEGSTLYVTLFPCAECMKIIIQKGIKQVFYLEDKYPNLASTKAAKRMADLADIKHSLYVPTPQAKIVFSALSDKILG